jgi:predicted secreted protein
MTTAVGIGSGAEFWFQNSSDVLTQIGEILGVPMPNVQTDEVEATHMASGSFREFIAGLKDPGEATFDINYVPGGAADVLLREAQTSGETRAYKIVLPVADGSTWEIEGEGFIKGIDRQVPIDDRMTATITFRFSGTSTEAAGA